MYLSIIFICTYILSLVGPTGRVQIHTQECKREREREGPKRRGEPGRTARPTAVYGCECVRACLLACSLDRPSPHQPIPGAVALPARPLVFFQKKPRGRSCSSPQTTTTERQRQTCRGRRAVWCGSADCLFHTGSVSRPDQCFVSRLIHFAGKSLLLGSGLPAPLSETPTTSFRSLFQESLSGVAFGRTRRTRQIRSWNVSTDISAAPQFCPIQCCSRNPTRGHTDGECVSFRDIRIDLS